MGLEGVWVHGLRRRGDEEEREHLSARFPVPDWIKVPIQHREEFVVAGHLPSSWGLGSLILGQYDREGSSSMLDYAAPGCQRRLVR